MSPFSSNNTSFSFLPTFFMESKSQPFIEKEEKNLLLTMQYMQCMHLSQQNKHLAEMINQGNQKISTLEDKLSRENREIKQGLEINTSLMQKIDAQVEKNGTGVESTSCQLNLLSQNFLNFQKVCEENQRKMLANQQKVLENQEKMQKKTAQLAAAFILALGSYKGYQLLGRTPLAQTLKYALFLSLFSKAEKNLHTMQSLLKEKKLSQLTSKKMKDISFFMPFVSGALDKSMQKNMQRMEHFALMYTTPLHYALYSGKILSTLLLVQSGIKNGLSAYRGVKNLSLSLLKKENQNRVFCVGLALATTSLLFTLSKDQSKENQDSSSEIPEAHSSQKGMQLEKKEVREKDSLEIPQVAVKEDSFKKESVSSEKKANGFFSWDTWKAPFSLVKNTCKKVQNFSSNLQKKMQGVQGYARKIFMWT